MGKSWASRSSLAEKLGAYSTGVCDEENRCTVGSLTPVEYGEAVAAQALRLGLRYVGGGWAVTPEHIRALRLRLT